MRSSSSDAWRRRLRSTAVLAAATAASLAALVGMPAPGPVNLLRNGGFEENRGPGAMYARWAAAPFARVGLEVLVRGEARLRRDALAPGAEAELAAVPVKGAGSIAIRIFPSSGDDPTGCLGDIVDAVFIE